MPNNAVLLLHLTRYGDFVLVKQQVFYKRSLCSMAIGVHHHDLLIQTILMLIVLCFSRSEANRNLGFENV